MANRFDINAEYQVDVSDLAFLAGLTERRIQQLEAEGVVLRLEHGKYDLVESVRALVEHTRSTARGTAVSEAEKNERAKLTRAKRRMAEIHQAELEGKVCRVDVMRKNLNQVGRILKIRLEAVPDRIAPLVAAETDRPKCHQMIADEIRQAQEGVGEDLQSSLVPDARQHVELAD